MLASNLLVKSNCSNSVHKTNNRSNFTNELLFSIKTDENEKISLNAIGLSNKFSNVPRSIQLAKYHILLLKKNSAADDTDVAFHHNIKLTENNYSSASEIALKLTNDIKNKEKEEEADKFITFTEPYAHRLTISITNCTIFILKEVFEWLQLTVTDSVERKIKFGKAFYKCVSLLRIPKRINSSQDLFYPPIFPRLIKVCLKEMSLSFDAVGFHKVISIIPGSFVNEQPCLYKIKQREYYELENEVNSKLTLCLLDENNFPLQIIEGSPTFAQFNLKTMSRKQFMLSLRSNDSTALFERNVNTNFKVYVKHNLFEESKNYEVALSSIFLPAFKLKNVSIFNKKDFYIEFTLRQDEMLYEFHKIHFETIAAGDLNTTTIAAEINRQVTALMDSTRIRMKYIEATKYLDDHMAIACKRDVDLIFSELFSATFDAVVTEMESETGDIIRLGKFSPERAYPAAIFLESSIAGPTIQASSYRHILKVIPSTPGNDEENQRYDSASLDFVPLHSKENIMLFQLRDLNEKEIPYKNNRETVLINLVFREVK